MGAGLLARDSAGGVRTFDVDIIGAADSLAGDVMVMLIVVIALMCAAVCVGQW
jgi:hypothetical protein